MNCLSFSIDILLHHNPRIGVRVSNTYNCYLRKKNSRTNQLNTRFHTTYSNRIYCSSAASLTMSEIRKESVFDVEKAGLLVNELKGEFKSGKTRSYEWRITQLKGLSQMLNDREKDIIQALQDDLSKPELEAYVSEIAMIKSAVKLALKDLKKWMKPEKVKTPLTTFPSSAEIVSEPLGTVLVISTWNYPFLLSLDPVIGAIAAGNTVVLKPSEISPATSSLLKNVLEEYVDTSCIKVIEGAVDETSALLAQKWDKIFYTGSGKVGRVVMAAAAKHLTPVILELGGKCPAIVDSNVDLKVAAKRIISGKWGCNNGQTCTAVDYILTTKEFAPTLIDALKVQLERFFSKDPLKSKDISRVVSLYHFNRLMKLLGEDGVSDKIILGGQTDEKQLKIAPTILLDVPEHTALMSEEIFGPLLPIITVENLDESFEIIKSRSKPLAAYLFTKNDKLKNAFVSEISAGGILINDTILHLTVSTLPFGGVGESGMGNYHGKFSFDAFSHKKSVLYRSFGGDAAVRYPPYTQKKMTILKALMGGNFFQLILVLLGFSKGSKKEHSA